MFKASISYYVPVV